MAGRKLVFKRMREAKKGQGMAEIAREFDPAPATGPKKAHRSALFGCMKGTFTIEPGYDLTQPVYTGEEWTEIEKEMEEDWDQIEQGMSKPK